jgi:hypothetical protein
MKIVVLLLLLGLSLAEYVTPHKAKEDRREYKIVTLSNGLKAILVSDSSTQTVIHFISLFIEELGCLRRVRRVVR